MFETSDGQKIAEFQNVRIGGEKGEYPLVLIGSIFYRGHKIVKDDKSGEFDKQQAEKEINEFLEFSDKTKIPIIIDVVGAYQEPLTDWCEYIGNLVDVPFLVDGMTDDSRIYAFKRMSEIGLLERAIYNSIETSTNDENLVQLKEIGVKNAVILCFDSRALTPTKKIKLLEGTPDKPGLIEKALKAGIKDYIVDAAVLDIPSLSLAAETIRAVKKDLKLPIGCAPINALAEWENRKMFGKTGNIVNTAAVTTYIAEAGANFIMYGSINKALHSFPGIALTDSINSYFRKRFLKKENHPSGFQSFLR